MFASNLKWFLEATANDPKLSQGAFLEKLRSNDRNDIIITTMSDHPPPKIPT